MVPRRPTFLDLLNQLLESLSFLPEGPLLVKVSGQLALLDLLGQLIQNLPFLLQGPVLVTAPG